MQGDKDLRGSVGRRQAVHIPGFGANEQIAVFGKAQQTRFIQVRGQQLQAIPLRHLYRPLPAVDGNVLLPVGQRLRGRLSRRHRKTGNQAQDRRKKTDRPLHVHLRPSEPMGSNH